MTPCLWPFVMAALAEEYNPFPRCEAIIPPPSALDKENSVME